MGKYDPLVHWLQEQAPGSVTMTFSDLETILSEPLPRSARRYRPWWGNSQAAAWVGAGWIVDAVDVEDGVVTFVPGTPTPKGKTVAAPVLDGLRALEEVAAASRWGSIPALVAAHTVFLDPATVEQTSGSALFPIIRHMVKRGTFGQAPDGRAVLYDDNTTPTDVFLWAAQRSRGDEVQFNHVWKCSTDPDAYTALWNVCCTPAFLAKTTDTNHQVLAVLKRRAWELYGHRPGGEPEPPAPAGFADLEWATMPAAVDDLEVTIRTRLKTRPKHRATITARQIGWAYSDGPDETV